MKKISLIIATIVLAFSPFMVLSQRSSYNQYSLNSKSVDDSNLWETVQTPTFTLSKYNDLAVLSNEDELYYGTILKYFYASNVEIDKTMIDKMVQLFKNNGFTSDRANYLVQNLIASTINLSIYGTSSDEEFFAEAFTKWISTPNDQKNKSWEITNAFFLDVFPTLIANGSLLSDEKINEVENAVKSVSDETVDYNLKLTEPNQTDALDLQYSYNTPASLSGAYWLGTTASSPSALNYIFTQSWLSSTEKLTLKKMLIDNNVYKQIDSWIYDTYTPASEKSIDEFQKFISQNNKYSSFDLLNSHLKSTSIADGAIRLPYLESYDILGSYLASDADYKGDASALVTSLKDDTLTLYNTLYKVISPKNDHDAWVDYLLNAFVISPDDPLKGMESGTQAYTDPYIYNSSQNGGTSGGSAFSNIVIKVNAFTLGDYNVDYKMGFWSSPNGNAVLFHEFGHAIDAFGAKFNENRSDSLNGDEDAYYINAYEGVNIQAYKPVSKSVVNLVLVCVAIVVVVAIIITLTIFLLSKRKPKNIS